MGELLRLRLLIWRMASAAISEGISTSRPTAKSNWCEWVVATPVKLPCKRICPGSIATNSSIASSSSPSSSSPALASWLSETGASPFGPVRWTPFST